MTTFAGASALTIIITPAGTGRYEARLAGDDRVLCVSRTPFFDGARILVAEGFGPNVTLVMRHAGSVTECLRSPLGEAAASTVEETKYGPQLRVWKAMPTLADAPGIALDERAARVVPEMVTAL